MPSAFVENEIFIFLIVLVSLWPFGEVELFITKLPSSFYWKLKPILQYFLCFTCHMTLEQLFKFFVLLLSHL